MHCLEPKQRPKIWKPQPPYLLQSALAGLETAAASLCRGRSGAREARPFHSAVPWLEKPSWAIYLQRKYQALLKALYVAVYPWVGALQSIWHLWLTASPS